MTSESLYKSTRQFTKEQAIEFANDNKWESMSCEEKAIFQLLQNKLCMPFDIFHEAIEKALKRPVYTHEFGLNRFGLIDELIGNIDSPSLAEIIAMLPEGKTMVVIK